MAASSFNFKAEYAKSARSSCYHCGETIEKNELRLAEMVQVRHSVDSRNVFLHCRRQILMERCDGTSECFIIITIHVYLQIPRWYHVKCFFTCREFTISDVNEFGNFDSLRWEDQQMIKEKCAEGATYNLRTEYARSGRSTCRGCHQKINDVCTGKSIML